MVRRESPVDTGEMSQRGAMPLTRRERNRRWRLLSVLLILLALLAYTTYYYTQNRRLPLTGLAEPEIVPPPGYLYSITGSGANRISYPLGVAVSDTNRVYVVDYGQGRISVFTTAGRFIKGFNKLADGEKLKGPVCVAVRDDEVWVTDRQLGTIEVFDLEGVHVRRFEPEGEELTWAPLALAFDSQGRMRVTDVGDPDNHRIHFFSAEGSRTATVGHTFQADALEDEPLGFLFPNGIATAKDGRVFVSDGNNRRVQVLSAEGEFDSFIDTSGIPRGLVIDSEGRLVVVDALAHTNDVYDLDGRRLTQFGMRGIGPGQFNFPNYIAQDKRGRLYISDRGNNQIQVWGWPKAEPPRVTPPESPLGWSLCLLPPLFLLPLLFLRKRRIVVTPDFVEMLVSMQEVAVVARKRRLRLVAPAIDAAHYVGRLEEGIDLGTLITIEGHSESDARALAQRYGLAESDAIYLSMAERAKALATQNLDLRRLAVLADVRAIDIEEFLRMFVRSGA